MDLEYKRIWVKGLVIDCPFGNALETCPAYKIRSLPIQERIDIVDGMGEPDLDQIITHHKNCLSEREGDRPSFYGT